MQRPYGWPLTEKARMTLVLSHFMTEAHAQRLVTALYAVLAACVLAFFMMVILLR